MQAPGDFYIFSLSLEGPLMSDDSLLTKEKMKRLSPSDSKTFSDSFPGYCVTASWKKKKELKWKKKQELSIHWRLNEWVMIFKSLPFSQSAKNILSLQGMDTATLMSVVMPAV